MSNTKWTTMALCLPCSALPAAAVASSDVHMRRQESTGMQDGHVHTLERGAQCVFVSVLGHAASAGGWSGV